MPDLTPEAAEPQRVLVLGGYGLIGACVMRGLAARGHQVTGMGRDQGAAMRTAPDADWVIHDIATLLGPGDWRALLAGIDVVVNCAGALQDTPRDDLTAIHLRAVGALAIACAECGTALVQISAVGADPGASTAFLRTKARAEGEILASGARAWVFRPGLVLAPNAYGGTALVRMLAAFPWIQPLAVAGARMQTIGIADVVRAVALAIEGHLPPGISCDLVEDEAHTLGAIVAAHRRWLGLRRARRVVTVPGWLARLVAMGADALGRLGWRSPLRSTAFRVLADGVEGDPAHWKVLDGPIPSMAETLAAMPASAENRLAARMGLLMPVVLGVLCLFWALSGVIGLVRLDQAAAVLTATGWPAGAAKLAVAFWSAVDIGLAGAVLIRRQARRACIAMIAVSAVYLVLATATVPDLWLDPLGPLVKVLPAMVLAAIAAALVQER